MFQKVLILLLLLLPVAAPSLTAQVQQPRPAELRAYLENRDLDEEEVRQRLLAEGIDVDRMSPAELALARPRIEAVVAAMESEQAAAARTARETAARSTDKIQDAVRDGASVEEAITEVTTAEAAEQLPASNIYGHNIFRNKSLQVYRATDNATPPDSYPLKPGDEIAVTVFGASQSDFILRVDDAGFVQLPNTVRIPVAGVPLGQARQLLANRLKTYYTFRDGQLSVRVQAARTITVNIFGEVENNGSYTLSSLNTGFNALVAAGGPTETGSVRNIQLNNGDETTVLDVYDYLRNPRASTALFLSNNATIYVPLARKIVTLEGGVRRPLRYELKDNETLTDLLEFAGGVSPRAETGNIRVTRYTNGQLELLNVDLAQQPGFALQPDDIVNVPVVTNPVENFVTIEGAVLLPGRYAFGDGVTVGELLRLGRLRPGARTDAAFLFRSNDDGSQRLLRLDLGADAGAREIALQRGDRLRVLAASAFRDAATFSVRGAVRDTTNVYPFPEDGALTLEEALLLAGGLRANAADEVVIISTPRQNSEQRNYRTVPLSAAAATPLQPFDQVVVYNTERFTDQVNVSVRGAVRQEGTYVYDPSLTLEQLLYLAGGLRISADPQRIEIFRLSINGGQETRTLVETVSADAAATVTLSPFDQVVVRDAAEFENIQSVFLRGEVRYPGTYALLTDNERLTDVIARAGGLTGEAFAAGATLSRPVGDIGLVVLDLDQVMDNTASPANVVLLPGDTLSVPQRQELVTIQTRYTLANQFGVDSITYDGNVQVAYQGPKSAKWYIDQYAGGINPDTGKPSRTTVEYANGQIRETGSFLFVNNYPEVRPGSTIRVGRREVKEKERRERRPDRFNWIGLAQVLIAGGTTIALIFLNQRD